MLGMAGRLIANLLLIVVTFSYAMFQGGFVSWFLFYTLIPFLLYSLALHFVPLRIEEVRREIRPSKLERGNRASVTIHFRNKTWFPLAFLTVREIGLKDDIAAKTTGSSNIFFVGWKRNFQWTYEISDVPRGVIEFSALQFTFADIFGWTVRRKSLTLPQKIIVYPKITKIHYRQIHQQFDQGGVLAPLAFAKDTSMVTGVRNYQAGDRFSWIHWKSFARDETLRTKDFEVRQSQEILIVLDATANKNFEESLELSASVLQTFVENNGNVSFYIAGEKQGFYPQIKRSQLEKVMRKLAMVKAESSNKIESLLMKNGNFLNTSILLFTGKLTDSLRNFFLSHGKKTKGIICVVVSSREEMGKQAKEEYANVKVIQIAETMFRDFFTEVFRP